MYIVPAAFGGDWQFNWPFCITICSRRYLLSPGVLAICGLFCFRAAALVPVIWPALVKNLMKISGPARAVFAVVVMNQNLDTQ